MRQIGIIINGVLVMEGTLAEILEKTNSKDLEDAFLSCIKHIVRRRNKMDGVKILLKGINQSIYG